MAMTLPSQKHWTLAIRQLAVAGSVWGVGGGCCGLPQ